MPNTTTTTTGALPTQSTQPIFTCRGSVRGSCGINHRSLGAAQACCQRDAAGIRSRYPSSFPTRAYSDRHPVGLTEDAQAQIEALHKEAR